MIKPTGNKILVKLEVSEKETVRGGIIVPGKMQDEAITGTVVALGSGNRDRHGNLLPFEVKVGDTVLLGKFGGTEVILSEKKYSLVIEEEILGIVSNE